MPLFAPDGVFPAMNSIVPAAWRGALPRHEIRDEMRRQLDAFEAAAGSAPDFVDGHQHVQSLPGIADDLIAELSARKLAGKCWLRDSADRPKRIFSRGKHWGKALTVAALARGFRGKARAAGFSTNDGFAGFSDFVAEADYAADFATYLTAPGQKQLVMCHPGRVDDELARLDPVTFSRETELALFAFGPIRRGAGGRQRPPDADVGDLRDIQSSLRKASSISLNATMSIEKSDFGRRAGSGDAPCRE